MPLLLYLWRKDAWYTLDRRLDMSQSQSGYYGENKNLVSAATQTLAISPSL
jgi:hypothetical protein